MPVTKLEDILIPYKSPLYSAKFNQIFQSFLTDIEALERLTGTIAEYLRSQFVSGLFVEQETGTQTILGPGEVVYNGKRYAFPEGKTIDDVVQNKHYIVFDGNTKDFAVKAPENLGDYDIIIARKVDNEFDYSVRPILQEVTGDIYEPLVYAISHEASLVAGKAKALAYILENGRLFSFDYRNKQWRPAMNIVYTQTYGDSAPTGDPVDTDIFAYTFVVPKFINKAHLEISYVLSGSDSFDLTITMLEGTTPRYNNTLQITGYDTVNLDIDLTTLTMPAATITAHLNGTPSGPYAIQISVIQ